MDTDLSTGLPELDELLHGLIVGDNVVWQVETVDDYMKLVTPYCRCALESGRRLVYFRFATHAPLVPEGIGADIRYLAPQTGFESFLDSIHAGIEEAGRGAFYVFDCLSELAVDWFSDHMLGNFFKLTCPYLYDMATIAYFALIRNYHSIHATVPIRETTQLMLDVYNHRERIYVRPLKVQLRQSPTMFMLHEWRDGALNPITDSCTISEILNTSPSLSLGAPLGETDVWNREFLQSEEFLRNQEPEDEPSDKNVEILRRMLRMVVSRDERVLKLVERYFTISDVFNIVHRTIGTGLIGGKAVGMLLARAILERTVPRWHGLLEVHDSFFIASDVFYSYLVRNGCWWIRQRQKSAETFLEGAQQARRRINTGSFPAEIERRFVEMLDHFGESPIIVRSSSLLEDNFGNSFAGKYESVFCPNQGSIYQRLENFIAAVKTVYASSIGEEALAYRRRHGLLDQDEQMGLLVQRVSGTRQGHLHFPQIAGVGFSFNSYAWSEDIDPEAGFLRLVFGLGTRAVDRMDNDYTRLVALNAPERIPGAAGDGSLPGTQLKVDVIDLSINQVTTGDFADVASHVPPDTLALFAGTDARLAREMRQNKSAGTAPLTPNFRKLLSETSFAQDMREVLHVVQTAYECPVDIEFTANFQSADDYKINIVQCRPLQMRSGPDLEKMSREIADDEKLLETSGPVIGRSRETTIDRIIYVVPAAYSALPISKKYSVARVIGRLTHLDQGRLVTPSIMLLGPGRWGTTTPSLGVPVSFSEIETIDVLCEIVEMRKDLVPEVSLGTHFFSEMVEMDILYFALFPTREGTLLDRSFFEHSSNRLSYLLPDVAEYASVVRVVDAEDVPELGQICVRADTMNQLALCYPERPRR